MKKAITLLLIVVMIMLLLPTTAIQVNADYYNGAGDRELDFGQRDFRWPVPSSNSISSCFLDYMGHNGSKHSAIDICAGHYQRVEASYNGTVETFENSCTDDCPIGDGKDYGEGYGNYVVLRHNYVTSTGSTVVMYTRYSHLSSVDSSLYNGKTVSAGDRIGSVGSTGSSTGYHVDFQICYGGWSASCSVDPYVNDLLEMPSGFNANGASSWCTCCYNYVEYVKELYSHPILAVTFDSTDVTSVSAKTATIFTWVTSKGTSSERGYYLGTSEGTMVKIPVQVYDAGWTRYSLEFNLNETYGDLSIGQQYYYKFYSIVDGTEYQSEVKQFSTSGPSGPSFDTLSLTTSETDARVCAWLNNPSGYIISTIGLQLGESPTGLSTVGFLDSIGWTRSHLQYNLSDYFGSLVPGRTYWARYFAIFAGNTYYSDYFNFTTPAAITFDPISAGEISDTSATVSCWMSNDGGKTISSLGFYWNAAGSSKEKTEIISGVPWTRANLVYSVDNVVGALQPSTTYYFQYYALADGIEYLSDVVSFTTSAAITFDPISVSDVTYNAATISCWMSNERGNTISSLGFYWNATGSSKEKTEIISGVQWTRANLIYSTDSIVGTLQPSTTYYFQYYAVANGTEYLSDVIIFTTTDIGSHTHEYTYSVGTAPSTTSAGYLIGICSLCSGTTTFDLPVLDTSNYDYAVLQTPSCTATGSARFTWKTTTYGTFSFDVMLPTTDHTYVNTLTLPTCVEQGYTTHTCSNCGDSYQDSYVEALGHDFGTWTQTKVPTCAEKGEEKRTCSRCDAFETQEVEALGHDIVHHAAQAPTCTTVGWEAYDTCSRCDYTTYVEKVALGHNYQAVVTAPTCTAGGYTTYTCSRCGDSYVDSYIDAFGHDFGAWTQTKAPTCTEKGEEKRTCSRCDAYETQEVEALGHDVVHHAAQAPTCTAVGWNAYDTCSRCDYTTYVEKAALGHDYQSVVSTPNCTEQGYTTHTCSRCGDNYKDTFVDALGHDFGAWTQTKAPTCTEKGEEKRTCSRCDAFEIHEIDALGHDYQAVVTAPTCTAGGYTTYTCPRCGDSYVADEVAALGHTPGDAVEENRVNPTCTENGGFDTVTYCSTCGIELSRVHTDLAALGHLWDDGVIDPAASCTADGVKTFTCQRCGETKTEAISATGHTPGESAKENEVSATCTIAGGYDMVIRCTTCNAILYTEHFETAALGHDYQAVVTAPTCTEGGYTTYTCSRCGDSYVGDETAALGHIPGEPVKENDIAPTCEVAGGYDIVVYCTACGAEISREHTDVAALGHDWNEPEYVWADDYSTVRATRTCKNDANHKETETVNTTSEVTKPATYEAEGEIVYTATFENEAFATQTKTVATPKLDGPKPYEPCDGGEDCPGNVFTDMPPKGNWAHDAIDWAIVNKITAGTSATTFSPNAGCTRAQVVTFLWRAAGEPEPETTNNPFEDVKEGTWYYKAVLWAAETGVTAGTSATTFSSDATCTRAQIVTFLWRFEGEPASATTNNPFTDVKAGAYYEKAVLWASETGVTAGTSATTFSPDATCTRAQVVTFLYRDIES